MIDVNTIIGEEIKLDNGVTIIPISKVTYGFGSGGSNFPSASPKDMFGGGVGAGATVQPLAFLVVNGTDVQLMQMNTGGANSDPVSKAIDVFPELVEKIKSLFKKEKNNTEEENPNPSS